MNRSRSETASSSASLRQRRQGFVPTRKPTNDLNRVSETSKLDENRSSSASTIKAAHSRQSSSVSTKSGFLAASSGGSSSGAPSPVDGPMNRFANGSRLSSLPENRDSRVQPKSTVKAAKRLRFTLRQLHEPVAHVATAIRDSTTRKSNLERRLFTANAQLDEVTRLLDRLEGGLDDSSRQTVGTNASLSQACIIALKSYSELALELKRSSARIASIADGIFTRGLMFQVYISMTEAKNICSVIGFEITTTAARQEPPRASAAWSSKTVTPTQPRPNTTNRQRGATILQSMASDTTLRAMPPPPVPSIPASASGSRTNTMTSMSSMTSSAAPTPRSAESFSALASARPDLSRSSTMRSVIDDADGDGQFDGIFLKLKQACDLAGQALPTCRKEFLVRMQTAQTDGQSVLTARWKAVTTKCDIAIANNRALRKRLDVVRVNDPNVRYSREFWQHCDGFVHVSLTYTLLTSLPQMSLTQQESRGRTSPPKSRRSANASTSRASRRTCVRSKSWCEMSARRFRPRRSTIKRSAPVIMTLTSRRLSPRVRIPLTSHRKLSAHPCQQLRSLQHWDQRLKPRLPVRQ